MQPLHDASAMHDCAEGLALSRLLDADDVDAALDAGLMVFVPCPQCDAHLAAKLLESRQRISKAWAARDRYMARSARLGRIAAEREAKRAGTKIEKKSSLPPSVSAVLARAKARAAERGTQ